MFGTKAFYLSVWRWHFFAGLYVVPFMLMLAITGLIMLFAPHLERWQNPDLFTVQQMTAAPISYEDQYRLVQNAYPDATVKRFYLPAESSATTRFQVAFTDETRSIFVDPYQGKILGSLSQTHSLYAWADDTHGTFMMGLTGDWLIEIATSFTILLIVTGVFLWWPEKNDSKWQAATKVRTGGRRFWKDAHGVIGVWTAILLLFFCISGLAWASVWGGKMVQAWSSFPMAKSAKNVSSTLTHNDLNPQSEKLIPWNLEQTAMPESNSIGSHMMTLDRVIQQAKNMGFTQFQVHFPIGEKGVYTATASTMGRDIQSATDDRTVHFDQYSGEVVADVPYADYGWFAKSMAWGIALHMGLFGLWNLIACAVFCLSIIGLCITGVMMWWVRRPSQRFALAPPPMPNNFSRWKHAVWFLIPVSILFPMGTLGMAVVLVLDGLAHITVPKVRRIWAS